MHSIRSWSLLLALGILVAGCQGPEAPLPDARPAAGPAAASAPSAGAASWPSLDADALAATARRLAGLETAAADAAVAALLSRHAAAMDAVWTAFEGRHLGAMRRWSEDRLAPRLVDPDLPLFYPFGGPDVPAALTFFPRAPSFVLIGLQPPGRLPDLDRLDAATLESELAVLATAFDNLVASGYFVTTQMDEDFAAGTDEDGGGDAAAGAAATSREGLDGVLPALLVFLARSGQRPIRVEPLTLDADGRPLLASPGAEGVRIDFVAEEGDPGAAPRTLFYFAVDLSDVGLAGSPGFVAFLERRAPWNVLMKSAEFLLHTDDFRTLRDLLLARARAVLEDESGLPFRSFDPESWQLELFGRYAREQPAAYQKWLQEDLVAAYAAAEPAPLGFAIGYHARLGEGCLILAQRRDGR